MSSRDPVNRQHLRLIATALVVVLEGPARFASSPVFWRTSTYAELTRGDVENLSIDSHGRLMLGPITELIYETTAPFLWTAVSAPDGSLYVGSGNEGRVFKVEPGGKGSVFFDATELEVHALALAPDGGLYVGTSPDGQIYKVDQAGAAKPFFDPDEKYIWALVVDGAGNVYAGTGERGVVYKITPDGKGVPFYSTKTTHVVSLALDGSGNILAGTESPGRLFRFDRAGKTFLLLDSSFDEIRMIRPDAQGRIYAAVVSDRVTPQTRPLPPVSSRPPDPPGREPVPVVTAEVTSIAIADVGIVSNRRDPTTREDLRSLRGAIFLINPDGFSDVLWESPEDSPYDLIFDADGSLLVATGDSGKILHLGGDPVTARLLTRAGAQQVTGFARGTKPNIYYTTSNPGKVFRLSSKPADRGTYVSDVRDAQTVSLWGTLSWRASVPTGSRVEIYTRSGNSANPDDTWSDWSGPYESPDGNQITSPNARYLQWRAVLTGKSASPMLTSVTVAYLQRNSRPQVTSITIHPSGIVFQKLFSATEPVIAGLEGQAADREILALSSGRSGDGQGASDRAVTVGRRTYEKGLQTIIWRAHDENNDELEYGVFYRREGETTWKSLKRELTDPIFVWDTRSVPDGAYLVKIVASDARSNAPGSTLSGELESTTIDIDNTPPIIALTGSRRENGRTTLLFEVQDDHSAIQRVEYSLDAERWRTIYPKDGIFDARFERFELALDGDTVRGAIIRAMDVRNNVATSRGDFHVFTAP